MPEWTCIITTSVRVRGRARLWWPPAWLLYPLGLMPGAWLFWRGVEGQLGADPVGTFEKLLGLWAIRFLAMSLAITPIRRITGVSLVRYRRALGLLAFIYAALHVTAYLGLDIRFDLSIFLKDLTRRPFIILGALALLLLVPLAVTSNRASIRRLGRRWMTLHRLVYLVALLAGIHLFLAFKRLTATSELYDVLLAALLAFRLIHHLLFRRAKAPTPR